VAGMAEWQSIEELVEDLNLSSDPRQPDEVAKEIRRKLAALHPDTNGGDDFRTDADRQSFQTLDKAREFVRMSNHNDEKAVVVSKKDLWELVERLRPAMNLPTATDRVAARDSFRTEIRSDTKARYSIRLRASGLFATATGALMTFSGSLKDNPVFGPLFQSPLARYSLVFAFLLSITLLLLTLFTKYREDRLTDYLLSESNRPGIVRSMLPFPAAGSPEKLHFELHDLIPALRWIEAERLALPLSRWRLWRKLKIPEVVLGGHSEVDLEKMAAAFVTELEGQGVVERVAEKRVVPRFCVPRSVVEELWKH
jgi:hypothetical protein